MKKQSNNTNNGLNINLILIIQLIVMLVLFILIVMTISKTTRQNSIEHMGTIADERAHIIDNYVDNAEKTLMAYSKAGQIKDVLEHPTDEKALAAAQKYTEDFSADVDNLEGIYVSEWNTHVLAHTNAETRGLITRKDPDKLKELQDAMLAEGSGVYDTGIIISPASQQQIVSMYKAVYNDNGDPIGLVGLGIYTDALVQTLDNMPIRGFDESFYSMVNVKDGNYIFNIDKNKIGQPAVFGELIALCNKYRNSSKDDTGSFEYANNGEDYVSAYSYMSEHGWLLMIDDSRSEVFSLTRNMRIYLNIFGLCVLGLMLLFHFINKKQQETAQKLSSAVEKNTKTKASLNKAVFKDILTDVNNRTAFSIDMDKLRITPETPRYFAMFNIRGFSEINSKFGNDAGDSLLVATVDTLSKFYQSADIYRTGSDEFVVSIPVEGDNVTEARMKSNVNAVVAQLIRPQNTSAGFITPSYKYALVKKASLADSSVVTVLKDLAEHSIEGGEVQYADMH